MISVQVRLFANLRQYVPGVSLGKPAIIELPEGSSLSALIAVLSIPPEETKQTFVNGLSQDLGYLLQDGDEVGIFPPIGGGSFYARAFDRPIARC